MVHGNVAYFNLSNIGRFDYVRRTYSVSSALNKFCRKQVCLLCPWAGT